MLKSGTQKRNKNNPQHPWFVILFCKKEKENLISDLRATEDFLHSSTWAQINTPFSK